jgi:hypothetical protein
LDSVVNKTTIKQEGRRWRCGWEPCQKAGALVVRVVDGGVHACQASTHGGAKKLDPEGIVELEDVGSHDEACCCRDHWCWKAGRKVLVVELEPVGKCFKAVGSVNVRVHRNGVGCDQDSCGGEIL